MMDVKVALSDGVFLVLAVEDGTTVKGVKSALNRFRSAHKIDLRDAENKVLDDSEPVPAHVALGIPTTSKKSAANNTNGASAQPEKPQKAAAPPSPPRAKVERKKVAQHKDPVATKDVKETLPFTAPELDEARKNVGKVAANSIQKICALSSPHALLVHVFEHVLLATGQPLKTWTTVTNEMSDIKFVKTVQSAEPTFSDRNLRKLIAFKAPEAAELEQVGLAPAELKTVTCFLDWLDAMIKVAHANQKAKRDETPAVAKKTRRAPRSGDDDAPAHAPQDAEASVQALAEAAKEVDRVKNSDFRELRSQLESAPVEKLLVAVLQALGEKKNDKESVKRSIINATTFQKKLTEAAAEPQKHLSLSRAEYLIFHKTMKDVVGMTVPKDEPHVEAQRAILMWVKAAHAWVAGIHRKDETHARTAPTLSRIDEMSTPRAKNDNAAAAAVAAVPAPRKEEGKKASPASARAPAVAASPPAAKVVPEPEPVAEPAAPEAPAPEPVPEPEPTPAAVATSEPTPAADEPVAAVDAPAPAADTPAPAVDEPAAPAAEPTPTVEAPTATQVPEPETAAPPPAFHATADYEETY